MHTVIQKITLILIFLDHLSNTDNGVNTDNPVSFYNAENVINIDNASKNRADIAAIANTKKDLDNVTNTNTFPIEHNVTECEIANNVDNASNADTANKIDNASIGDNDTNDDNTTNIDTGNPLNTINVNNAANNQSSDNVDHTDNADEVLLSIGNNNESESKVLSRSNSNINKSPTGNLGKNNLPSPFKKSFLWPEIPEKNSKPAREKLPAVASSEAWLAYQTKKINEKEKIEKTRGERRMKRDEKSKKAAQNNNPSLTPQKKIMQKKQKPVETTTKIVVERGNFVIFKYESKLYPGVVVATQDRSVLVSSMIAVINGWKWPEKEDRLWYDDKEIVEIISEPKAKNNRGVFEVAEMDKWQ